MKKILCYMAVFVSIIILIPLIAVKGCGSGYQPPGEQKGENDRELIKVYVTESDREEEMLPDEYLKGVLAAEMPASFNLEALKAQAVAARSYAYARMKSSGTQKTASHNGADICTDPKCCQAWISKSEAYKKWGILTAYYYWNKITKAVTETHSQVLTYQGELISPPYHANSGGRTENAEEVWEGKGQPYLVSVESKGEESAKEYTGYVDIQKKDFIDTLMKKYSSIVVRAADLPSDIRIIDYTVGGRVKNIAIANLSIKGTEFRSLFSLRSADFKIIEKDANTLRITTIGYGHGVGMSQRGANCMAKEGSTFDEILKYYYRGVDITDINSLK